MRAWRRVAFGATLACSFVSPGFAIEPDDLPWDEIDRVLKEQPASPDVSSPGARHEPPADDINGGDRNSDTHAAAPPSGRGDIDGDRLDPEPDAPVVDLRDAKPPQTAARPESEPESAMTHFEPTQAVPAPQPQPSPPVQAMTSPATPAQTGPAPASPASAGPAPAAVAPVPDVAPPAAQVANPPASVPPSMAPPPVAVPSAPVTQATTAVDGRFYLPLKRYIETKAAVTLKDYDEADRAALLQFQAARMGQALWVSKDGFNVAAESLIAEIKKAADWGLSSADYKIPGLIKIGTGDFSDDDLSEAELKLSLTAMEYARHARGDRIDNPTEQLSSYLDRKPQLVDRQKLLEALASSTPAGDYIRSLHPKHVQFERLRQKLLALRSDKSEDEFEKIPEGPKITPGKSHWQVALVRRRLKVQVPGMKPDGTSADENFYDDGLASAVIRYKEKNDIEPINATITTPLRTALNRSDRISEEALLANMEEWRWMPDDLGATHIEVNLPEFMVRVVKNGSILHEERIVAGKFETQTPIFSDNMRTIVFQPPWNVPESIKVKELLPGLRDGNNPIERQGLLIKRNGRDIDVWDVDWEKADIREYNIYQPPGDANVLGIVKFLFPNKHSVYLHDTPSKRLFDEKVRMFSHGCMRVRNPVRLAEVIMAEDKGWSKDKINELITSGPEDNDIALDKPLPVHVMYFTAWVDDNGGLKTFADVYGHEQRIKLGLEGRWGEIVKNRDHLLPADDEPIARNRDDWGDSDEPPVRPVRQPRVTYREPPPPPPQKGYKIYSNKNTAFGDFMKSLLGNGN